MLDRTLENEVFNRGKSGGQGQFAQRFFFDICGEDDAVGRTALRLFDFKVFLKISQRFDAFCGPLDLNTIKGIPFIQAEFAAENLILRQRIAVNVDPFDKHARGFRHAERNAHGQRFFVSLKIRVYVGKSITKQTCGFRQAFDSVFDLFGVIPVAFFYSQSLRQTL